jgi:hypothetical protein
MRKLSVLLLAFVPGWLAFAPAPAQELAGQIIFSQNRQFRIPFRAGAGTAGVKQLQLFYSLDQGRTWQPAAIAPPEQGFFRFLTDRDGYFWFTVQTTDLQNRVWPVNLAGAEPSLKVVVDTQPPTAQLQPLPPRNGEVGVAWSARDDNLDLAAPDALRLEYRLAGGTSWVPLPVNPAQPQLYWNPQANGLVEVRLKARDRAGNGTDAVTTVSLSGGGIAQPGGSHRADPGPAERPQQEIFNGPADADRKLVNSKRITLNYDLKEVGPSGVSLIELWYTTDGRSWNKYPKVYGEDKAQTNISFDVVGEGVYGITLIARSGVGLGERPPQIGDRPQIWIEVDTTKPRVQLQDVIVGTGADKGKMTVLWRAQDKNLGREPIALAYAEKADGPWKSFGEKLPNTGQHVWQIPAANEIPWQFYVRVEAVDRAGNIGEAVTDSLVKVDLSTPKVDILKVQPGGQ